MGKENLLKRIWNSIKLFFTTVLAMENRKQLDTTIAALIRMENQAKELNCIFSKFMDASAKMNIKMLQTLYGIRSKAYFPILMNSKGKALNLFQQGELNCEMKYDGVDKTIIAELMIDRTRFDAFSLDIASSYSGDVKKPLFEYAGELFKERDRNFMDKCSYGFILNLLSYSFQKELLTNKDIMEILGGTILEMAKPSYIEKNNLKDFDYDKGPVYKEEETKEE